MDVVARTTSLTYGTSSTAAAAAAFADCSRTEPTDGANANELKRM